MDIIPVNKAFRKQTKLFYNINICTILIWGVAMGFVKEVRHYVNVSLNGSTKIPTQVIDFYDLTFVLKGRLTYIVDGTKYELKENDAIFIKPGSCRERIPHNTAVKYASFNFTAFRPPELDTFLKGVISGEIRALISVFPQSRLSDLYHSKEKLESILNYILYEIMDMSLFKSKNPYIVEILKFVESNLSKKLSLADISDHVHLTREYTASLFKKEMGKTITEYVNQRKMMAAKNMIDSGAVNLKEVAAELGFENYSYFSKVFKKHYKITPVKRRNT